MAAFALLAYVLQWIIGRRGDHRMALRFGMAGGFILSGVDHFFSAQERYVPMLPDFLSPIALQLVYVSGVTELLGSLGLVMPLGVYRRLGLPNLRKWAGLGIALMLLCLMVANINVAIKASAGHTMQFEAWTYWLRLLFQPLFMVWALYSTGAILGRGTEEA